MALAEPPAAALPHVRACYPFVRLRTTHSTHPDTRLAYGFVAHAGHYETTLTRPDLFADYYREQFGLLLATTRRWKWASATSPSPALQLCRRRVLRRRPAALAARHAGRGVRPARPDGHGRPHRQRHPPAAPGEPLPLALFTAPRVDYSLQRLRHYTGTSPEHFQNFVLFTNYQFYIDEFIALGEAEMKKADSPTAPSCSPATSAPARGQPRSRATTAARAARLPQMPAYHLMREDRSGITMVNIGVGPSNAKNITDHVAVLRPHAWIMLGHCAGLRNRQQLGDYVLAHGYVREDHVLDEELPLWIRCRRWPRCRSRCRTVAEITQLQGAELKRMLRTGTVATTDNRNWELLARAPQQRFAVARSGAGHGKRHHRRQRLFAFGALRHPAVRERQAAARRDQAARHGQPLLPRARGPAPAIGIRALERLSENGWTACTAASCAALRRWRFSRASQYRGWWARIAAFAASSSAKPWPCAAASSAQRCSKASTPCP
jgi:AMP nucleosidase